MSNEKHVSHSGLDDTTSDKHSRVDTEHLIEESLSSQFKPIQQFYRHIGSHPLYSFRVGILSLPSAIAALLIGLEVIRVSGLGSGPDWTGLGVFGIWFNTVSVATILTNVHAILMLWHRKSVPHRFIAFSAAPMSLLFC